MMGIELARPCADIVKLALAHSDEYGVLINVTQDRVVRLLPPLIINADETARLAEGVISAIRAFITLQAVPKAA